jgi:hypothetical protein
LGRTSWTISDLPDGVTVVSVIPEPTSLLLVGAGLAFAAIRRRFIG